MIVAILGTNAASSNPPSNGVSYGKNNQTTVEGALNDLYTKANYGNASASQILSGKTALVGGKQVIGTMPTMKKVATDKISGVNVGHANALRVDYSSDSSDSNEKFLFYSIPQNTYTGDIAWVRATNADVASAIGLTAGKLLKGQTVLGITGTGETGYSSCSSCCPTCPTCLNTSDATATAADISDGKTAYVNGQKITGKGMKGKTYEFTNEEAKVSGQTFKNGTWTKMVPKGDGNYTDFSITLPFTPEKVHSCHVNLTGNFYSDNTNRWDADFRMDRESGQFWYMTNLSNDFYVSGSNSLSNYTDTSIKCLVEENKLILRIRVYAEGSGASGLSAVSSRADKFYLTGVLAYD
jgi:hypothetical protein